MLTLTENVEYKYENVHRYAVKGGKRYRREIERERERESKRERESITQKRTHQ